MKVAYITTTPFFDSCIERIRYLSREVELSVYIMMAPYNLKSTVVNFNVEYSKEKIQYELSEIATKEDYDKLNPYFINCKSVVFFVLARNNRAH